MSNRHKKQLGFSLIELLVSMTIMLVLLTVASSLLAGALRTRTRESQKTDALTAGQAALNVLSREVANAGFGIYVDPITRVPSNGIVLADSNSNRIRIRANVTNFQVYSSTGATSDPGEDITYFVDTSSGSIIRYDPNAGAAGAPTTSVVVNRISSATFAYVNYSSGSSATTTTSVPTAQTGRVIITVAIQLDPVVGQVNPDSVSFTSDVTLRNANYILQQY